MYGNIPRLSKVWVRGWTIITIVHHGMLDPDHGNPF